MSKVSLGYYPGCSGLGTSQEYDASTRAICRVLDVQLKDIPDWTCCGSTPAHTVDHVLSTALACRNFAQAETAGITDVATPCPSCLKNLRNALDHMEDPLFKARVEALTLRPLQTEHTIKSVLQVLIEDVGIDAIAARVVRPLKGLKVVPYYGCLMHRPAGAMKFDDPENPTSLDKILEALGAEVLPFPLKVECCGASFGIPRKDVVTRLTGKLLDLAASLGADVVAVACPLCQMNLDLRQGQVNAANGTRHTLPIPYFTQLMGYAFGLDAKTLGFKKLIVDLAPAFETMQARAQKIIQAEAEAAAKAAAKAAPKQTGETKVSSAKTTVADDNTAGGDA